MTLLQEKARQAIEILNEQNTDMWLTFVRETSGVRDPILDFLIGPNDLTWQSALLFTRKGDKIAIVGNLEKEAVARLGVFDEILGYDKSIRDLLRATISRFNPDRIAVNTSRNNVHADGLTHAMYEILRQHLSGTPYADRLVSAEPLINALRGRKTPEELARIKRAIEITDEIYRKTFAFIQVGMTEMEIGAYMHKLAREYRDYGVSQLAGGICDYGVSQLADDTRNYGVSQLADDTRNYGVSQLADDTRDYGVSQLAGGIRDYGVSQLAGGIRDYGVSQLADDTRNYGVNQLADNNSQPAGAKPPIQISLAWAAESCPAVNSGPNSPVGHSGPSAIRVERGHIIHFDFGVKYEGYCSDLQRVCYVLREGETEAPPEVQRGFIAARTAIEKAREAMKAGVTGNSIDAIARAIVTDAGYPEYPYALGHQLGRAAHDGGALLGPLWEKYGDAPNQHLEVGQVFAVEPGLMVPGYGYIGLEENVFITENGAEYFTEPQREIVLIKR